MRVSEIMTSDVRCLPPTATLREAADLMASGDFGAVPVCDRERLAGVVTDRDIVIRGVAVGLDPGHTAIREVMSPRIIYGFEDQSIEEIAELMERHQIRRLPILDRNKMLVGIVSLGDIAVDAHQEELSGEVLECVSEPVHA